MYQLDLQLAISHVTNLQQKLLLLPVKKLRLSPHTPKHEIKLAHQIVAQTT